MTAKRDGRIPGQDVFDRLRWRLVGPYRGGRVVAVTGDPDDRATFYMGSTGGGVWKTTDAGTSWRNVSDGFFARASVGALALAPSDPNVLYAGMGEACIRNNVAPGDGVYRSTDAGATWTHLGLAATRHISRIRIHPTDPDVAYVAALGRAHGPNEERGVYRSTDGGRNWELVLHRGPDAGAADLVMDPHNPRILYASLWQTRRLPWRLDSGGPASGLWRSTDGGDTWTELSRRPGLPKGPLGRIGITASAAKRGRVWAIVEAEDGAVLRSDDHGDHWDRLSEQGELRYRAWYYQHVFADPKDAETVWALDMDVWRSQDGGRTFELAPVPHGDAHDLWMDPADPSRLIMGADGGASVSMDGGVTWSSLYNQPTAELYHVITDTRTPYRIYAAQQDNSTIALPSHSEFGVITQLDTYDVGGGESGYIAVRPDNPDIVFAGSYGGLITRYDHARRAAQPINVWPELNIGAAAAEARYRFNWTAPIMLSPHDPKVLYQGGNHVFRSTDEGRSWEAISPDLSRNDPDKLASSGGLTADNTGAEYYCTVFALAESPVKPGVLWAGTDDGLVHVSRNGGSTWRNVTPPDFPEWAHVSMIEPSRHNAATAYVVGDGHRLDDFRPYLWRTRDHGKSWERLDTGLSDEHLCRVVREDPGHPEILYLGTELGVHVSHDGGASWSALRANLPQTPVHDLAVKGDDLVAATHGRSIWILEDLPAVREQGLHRPSGPLHVYEPKTFVRYPSKSRLASEGTPGSRQYSFAGVAVIPYEIQRTGAGEAGEAGEVRGKKPVPVDAGQNGPQGVTILYWLSTVGGEALTLTFLDGQGKEIRTFSRSRPEVEEEDEDRAPAGQDDGRPKDPEPPYHEGLNRFVWDTRHERGILPDNPPRERGLPEQVGPAVPPGTYEVRVRVGDHEARATFDIAEDPRNRATAADLRRRYQLALGLWRQTSDLNRAVNSIREVKAQLARWCPADDAEGRYPKEVETAAASLRDALTDVERQLTPVDPKGSRRLSNPPGLDDKLRALSGFIEAPARPTASATALEEQLSSELDGALGRLAALLDQDLAAFNDTLREAGIPAAGVSPEPADGKA